MLYPPDIKFKTTNLFGRIGSHIRFENPDGYMNIEEGCSDYSILCSQLSTTILGRETALYKYIKSGEEITADYALWEADENYISKWECSCGSIDCRKKITGKDWRINKIQEKYKDHFSPLINKRIKML